ncbi:phospho-sugar mutase [Candidatus Protochlamydia amoebophila]|uniref:Phosphoglucomutase n=1 Tax=Candidatus Protochlamydia amoebophila TaxID=362787 RepID=A0A0C1JVL1_9BACT|nr:phospho-sugar mutase [Candidatus Protochlamydia amoebophila]KIC71297.1 Phosphoglucomutase [Candidatus Protochlamydia amoebophila]
MELAEKPLFDLVTQKNVNLWLEGQYDVATKAEIKQLLLEDPKHIVDAFFTNLTFGTGGLRGIMGVGTNRMNFYTVRAATQGLANYINKQPNETQKKRAVFIGYDSRHHSREFAEETAKVLAANKIHVYLFKDIRPTPLVSFACRYKKCIAAVMITASHNPPEYNGYKVYWSDGGQLVPPHDDGVIAEASRIVDPNQVKVCHSLDDLLIEEIDNEIDEAYLKAIRPLQHYPEINRKQGSQLKIAYTSLHGTGITMAPLALKEWGFTNYVFVEPQVIPDGTFPTVRFPNPEEPAALKLGIELMLQSKCDLLIANDPDADRMGIAVLHKGEAVLLNGNQICALLLEHVCEALAKQKKLPEKSAFIKTIGTTELFQAICDAYERPCFNVLTGFKYIAEKIHEWELFKGRHQFIFGGEESYGYLLGTHARDKDAIVCSALISELALKAKLEGKTLLDKLHDLYHKYGIYQEKLLSINFGETKEGKEQMSLGMQKLRSTHLKNICGIPVMVIEDYLLSTKIHLETNQTDPITLPISDVLLYWLKDGTKVMVRPSGTEPKVKIYCGLVEKQFTTIEQGLEISKTRCDQLLNFMKTHLMS